MIHAILVDDEQRDLQHLKIKLNDLGTVGVVKTFSNAEDFLNEIERLDFQVVFSEIELSGLSGLELARAVQKWNKDIYIVFVTAQQEYAIQAFELNSIDYLLKPILKDRLQKTITRIQKQMQIKGIQPASTKPVPPSTKVICFDEFVLYHQDEPVKWRTPKSKELFAFFITNFHTYIHRDTIIDQLWPEHDYKKAKIQLHTSMSHLRKMLDSIGHGETITFLNQSYSLALDTFQCDVIDLEQMIDEHPIVNHENIHAFEQAVQQIGGSYMEKNSYKWAAVKAQSIRQKLFHLLQKMIDYFSASHDLEKTLHYLQKLHTLNRYSEYTLQQLMLHFAKIGKPVEAVNVYQNFTEALLKDIGIAPEPATVEVYESIVGGVR